MKVKTYQIVNVINKEVVSRVKTEKDIDHAKNLVAELVVFFGLENTPYFIRQEN